MLGAHNSRPATRGVVIAFQIIVILSTIFGPLQALADEPAAPTPEPSAAPTASADPSASPVADETPAPTEPAAPTEPPAAPSVAPSADPTAAPPAPPATSPYLVTFDSGTSAAEQLAALTAAGAASDGAIPELRMHAARLSADAIAALQADASVARLDADRTRAAEAAPSDSSYGDQWSLPQVGWDQVFGSVVITGSTVALGPRASATCRARSKRSASMMRTA